MDKGAMLELAGKKADEKCPRCHGTGWWGESKAVGRDGYSLTGGPCDCGAYRPYIARLGQQVPHAR